MVKGWLARAVAGTVRRGDGGSRVFGWSRWFGRAGPVPDGEFQGPDEPYPDHWRQPPRAWPPALATGAAAGETLRQALGELPRTWRVVVVQRDVDGRSGDDVARDLGISVRQQRRILTQARASLRQRLAALESRDDRP